MTYDPTEPTTRDIIRGYVGDVGPSAFVFADVTYDSIIARYTIWQFAGAEIARRMARTLAAKPVAIGSDGDSVRWSDERVKSLYAIADELEAAGQAENPFVETDVFVDLNYLEDCDVIYA